MATPSAPNLSTDVSAPTPSTDVSAPTTTTTTSSNDVLAQLQRIRANLAPCSSSADSSRISSKPTSRAAVLAPASPTKKRPALSSITSAAKRGAELLQKQRQDALEYATLRAQALTASASARSGEVSDSASFTTQRSSSFLDGVTAVQKRKDEMVAEEQRARKEVREAMQRAKLRTSGFDETPKVRAEAAASMEAVATGVARDERLALVEKLEIGPRHVAFNECDPDWQRLEPYSGTRLKSRTVSHQDLTDYLQMRYHIPPSLLYSVVRPLFDANSSSAASAWMPDGFRSRGRDGDYDVPVDGDWLTIGVIAEIGPVCTTKHKGDDGRTTTEADDESLRFREAQRGPDGKLCFDLGEGEERLTATERAKLQRENQQLDLEAEVEREQQRQADRQRQFNVIKLVDLCIYDKPASSLPTGGVRGDKVLNLMSFQADEVDETLRPITSDRPEVQAYLTAVRKGKRKFANGSKGAYELLRRQTVGTVVALLNPKLWRPRRGKDNTMTLVPRSAEDVLVIGQASDLTTCRAINRNGNRCGNYVDQSQRLPKGKGATGAEGWMCDFHLNQSIGGLQKGRMEFANSTNGLGFGAPGQTQRILWSSRSSNRSSYSSSSTGGSHSQELDVSDSSSAEGSQEFHPEEVRQRYNTAEQGLEPCTGRTFTVEPRGAVEAKSSDPESWKFDIANRLGRGRSEKEARIRKQQEKQQLERRMHQRFGVVTAPRDVATRKKVHRTKKDATSAPSGTWDDAKTQDKKALQTMQWYDGKSNAAALLEQAKKTVEERKRKLVPTHPVAAKRSAIAPTHKVTSPSISGQGSSMTREGGEKHYTYSAEAIQIMGFDPLAKRERRDTCSDAKRFVLLDRIHNPFIASQPKLKVMKHHRPKIKSFDHILSPPLHKPAHNDTIDEDDDLEIF